MSSDVDVAIAQDTAKRVAETLEGGLTPEGKAYVERFARYLLRVNGSARLELAGKAKRPTCKWPLTMGRRLREAVARELKGELDNRGRKLRLPDDLVL